jgi:hypothetical protein
MKPEQIQRFRVFVVNRFQEGEVYLDADSVSALAQLLMGTCVQPDLFRIARRYRSLIGITRRARSVRAVARIPNITAHPCMAEGGWQQNGI